MCLSPLTIVVVSIGAAVDVVVQLTETLVTAAAAAAASTGASFVWTEFVKIHVGIVVATHGD
jgi:hypothetical protein